jgi:hypothetical protein
MRKSLVLLAATLLGGCGIPGDTLLMDLTADDAELICNHAVDEDAADRTVTCDFGDVTLEASTMSDCTGYFASVLTVANPACTATLDTWVACKEEPDLTDGQVCGTEEYTPSADCIAVVTCVTPPAAE